MCGSAALTQRMLDFEVSASDPSRLRGSSIRLLEEEKFRKTYACKQCGSACSGPWQTLLDVTLRLVEVSQAVFRTLETASIW
jgi:hypothetical protein